MTLEIQERRPEFYISDKEYEVLRLLQEGKTETDIAKELHVSKSAISMRIRSVRERYRTAKKFIENYEKERGRIPNRYL